MIACRILFASNHNLGEEKSMEASPSFKKSFNMARMLAMAGLLFSQLGMAAAPVGPQTCQPSIEVANPNDSGIGSLRNAMAGLCSGGTITFNAILSGGTIPLATTLTISQSMTIDGSALANRLTISGDNGESMVRVFNVTSGITATLNNLRITHGYNAGSGAGIYNQGDLTVTNSILYNNIADSLGGGICNDAGTLNVTDSTLAENSAGISGGGIYNNGGTMTVRGSTFSTNSADDNGGGIYNQGPLTVTNSTLVGNTTSSGGGGGMYLLFTIGTVNNLTIQTNSAGGNGGGIYFNGSSSTTINNTIFWDNTVTGTGAQLYATSSPTLNDSVVQGGYGGGTHIITADPRLGPLGNNGGPTQTIPLYAGSSALNAGNVATCAGIDQRGVSRPLPGHCDVGAFEGELYLTYMPMVRR